MALKAGGVRICTGGNGEPDAALRRSMTDRAIYAGVPRVVKLSAECPQPWKRFHSAGLSVGMADRADGARVIGKLKRVATDTGRMAGLTGEAYPGRIGIAAMAEQTGHSRVECVCVSKVGVIFFLCLRLDDRGVIVR